MKRKNTAVQIKKITALFITVLLICSNVPAAQSASEVPEAAYTGDINASAILKNLDYADVKRSGTWAKEAIYESGALEILKGLENMNRRFGMADTLSKEEAIAIAYRAAGREAEAQTAGENLNNARPASKKKTDPLDVWYDGYLQLAAKDGLITQQNLVDAQNADQSSLTSTNFRRTAAAQRQEMAFWLAKTINLQPVRGQQSIFNSYIDWRSSDPEKIPFIEAILENKIMSGDDNGRFSPTKAITREQAAQVVKNAEGKILPALKYEKLTGMIEDISAVGAFSKADNLPGKTIYIRNSKGKLHTIATQSSAASSNPGRNEQAGTPSASIKKELVVYRNGAIGDSSLLKNGDRIEYIADTSDKSIKYVNVISNVNNVRYVAAQINSKDKTNLLIGVLQYFKLDYPDLTALQQNVSFALGKDSENITYRYSKNASVTVNGDAASIDDISPDMTVILTIGSNNVVTAIQSADFGINSEEGRVVKGIVEDNNPQLGYITLYNEDGTGTGKTAGKQLAALRTYNYVNQNKIEVLRNHEPVKIDSVETGDTAFVKLDEDGNVISISAVDNYGVKYGTVLSKLPGEIIVEFENGMQQIFEVGPDVLLIQDKKLTSYNALRDGDRVKLILNTTNKSTDLKEITIEGSEHFITNIYKGAISYIDDTSNNVNVLNVQVFNKGRWERTDQKGFTKIPLSENYQLFLNDKEVNVDKVNRLLNGSEAYIAVETDYGGKEKAVLVSYRNSDDSEILYNDSIAGVITGGGSFGLTKDINRIKFGAGSIVIKYGRLVSGNSLSDEDQAYVVANRSYGSGDYTAGVVKVDDRQDSTFAQIYRARIKQINDNQDFTVESFSQLKGTGWEYQNTPKTFRLTFNTRILEDDGILSTRDFIGYGENSYLGTVVYVLADDTDTLLISTAPYGVSNVKGTVYDVTGGETGEEGTILTQPDSILLRSAKSYNPTELVWMDAKDMTLDILQNSIIIKDGKIAVPSDIKKGDTARVIKKDTGETGDAYIIIIE